MANKKQFKKVEYIKKRADEGKAVYGSAEYTKNSKRHRVDVTFYKMETGEYLLLVEEYDPVYAPEEGNLTRDERKVFKSYEELLGYIQSTTSIQQHHFYYT